MKIRFIAQPHSAQLGVLLTEALSNNKFKIPACVTIVSAFASLATVIRLKGSLLALHEKKTKVRIVVGVDMGGTSKEVLKQLASWPVEVFVFKNKKSGVTFHPKIYVVERDDSAEIFVGSNNLTDGGLFKNYEGAAHVSYTLPEDAERLAEAKVELSKYLEPLGAVAKLLDAAYLEKLLLREDIPSDAEARNRSKAAKVGSKDQKTADETFGFETTPGAAALPPEYQEVVIAANTHQMDNIKKSKSGDAKTKAGKGGLLSIAPIAQIASPSSFYMELNATKGAGGNIPGEQRIPLEAVWSAQDFWGWPENYTKDVNPRKSKAPASKSKKKGVDRIYHNWRPVWTVSQAGDPKKSVKKNIRMYFYENSSDFRFTSGDIANWGDPGDIVRISRVDDASANFECVLAKKGSAEHKDWKGLCKQQGRSKRLFGFA